MSRPPCNGGYFVARDIPQYTTGREEPDYYIKLALPVDWEKLKRPCWWCLFFQACKQREVYDA
jgi:hypothetical protein